MRVVRAPAAPSPSCAQAAARVSGLELGGLAGSLLAGRLSDALIAEAAPGEGHVGKRLRVVRPPTAGNLLLATCYLPLSTFHFPLATCHLLLATCYSLLATRYSLTTCYALEVRGYLVGVALALCALWTLPPLWWAQWACIFTLGFFLYGPQVRKYASTYYHVKGERAAT